MTRGTYQLPTDLWMQTKFSVAPYRAYIVPVACAAAANAFCWPSVKRNCGKPTTVYASAGSDRRERRAPASYSLIVDSSILAHAGVHGLMLGWRWCWFRGRRSANRRCDGPGAGRAANAIAKLPGADCWLTNDDGNWHRITRVPSQQRLVTSIPSAW